jgi:TetR/AcrR family transcriptional regulator of autoinduction and epiphytic fitness
LPNSGPTGSRSPAWTRSRLPPGVEAHGVQPFPSKEELFAEILNQLWARITEEQTVSYRADQPLREQLLPMLLAKLQMMADDNFLGWRGWRLLPPFILERAQDMVARMGEREEGLTVWIRAALAGMVG